MKQQLQLVKHEKMKLIEKNKNLESKYMELEVDLKLEKILVKEMKKLIHGGNMQEKSK